LRSVYGGFDGFRGFLRQDVTQFLRPAQKPARIAGVVAKNPKVTRLPLTRAQATEIVREISGDSTRWAVMVQYKNNADWHKVVNRRQIELCLREGYILVERASMDENNNWRFSIARVCGGLNVVIDVALEGNSKLPKLYVLKVNGDEI
jgi:hypothetical protein